MEPIHHHSNGLPMIHQAGEYRVLGCLPPYERCGLPEFGDAQAVLQPAQWKEICLPSLFQTIPVEDQGKTSSCVGHATASALTFAWLQAGGKYHHFSPTYVYGLINGGRDAGAVISDAMTVLKNYGDAESSLVPEGMIFRQQFPAEAFANAKRFRAVEVLQCRTFADICTALSLGFPVVTGILVGQNFGNLDAEGVAPLPDTVLGGHALPLLGLKYSQRRGAWLPLIKNSWSERWGVQIDTPGGKQGGYAYLTEAHWNGIRMDSWAIPAVFTDPDDHDDDLPVAH